MIKKLSCSFVTIGTRLNGQFDKKSTILTHGKKRNEKIRFEMARYLQKRGIVLFGRGINDKLLIVLIPQRIVCSKPARSGIERATLIREIP